MKICLLSREYPPETAWGGIGTYTYTMAHGLAAAGHQVHVVSCTRGKSRDFKDGEVALHRLHLPGFGGVERFFPATMLTHSFNAAMKVNQLARDYGIDIVESPEWYAESFWYGFNRRAPLVVKFHAPRFLIQQYNGTPGGQRVRLICALEKSAALRADSLCSPCSSLARIIAEKYRVNPAMIKVIPNFIRLERSDGPAVRGLGRFVLFAGRLERIKGALVLGEAIGKVLKACPDVRFIFAGKDSLNSPEKSSMKEYLLKLNRNDPNLIFLGHCVREELFGYYRAAAVCVVPSLWETFPYSGLEAMSFAKPIVGSSVGGMSDIVEDGRTGLLFPPGDANALARALIRLLKNDREAVELGRRGRLKLDRQFSCEKVVAMQCEHYKEVIAKFPSRR